MSLELRTLPRLLAFFDLAVRTAFPTSIERRSSVNVSFASRDFYSNDISVGYGDEAFEAWTISTPSHKARETVKDLGDGSYRVEMRTQNVSGTELFFLQRNGLNIPGSPFEVSKQTTSGKKRKKRRGLHNFWELF